MRLRFRWTARQPAPRSERRLEQFRSVLKAALETRRYRPVLESAGLGNAKAIAQVTSIAGTLSFLPRIGGREYRSAAAEYRNLAAPLSGPQKLRFPLARVPRTAVLMPGFAASGPVQVFTADWERRLGAFRPEALAGPVSVLRRLAKGGKAERPQLRNALIAFTRPGEDVITDADRELLWRVFQVPVFEQFLGFDGRVVAWECEAHDGLHVEEEHAFLEQADDGSAELLLTSLTDLRYPALRVGAELQSRFEHAACACGRVEPRLAALRPAAGRQVGASCAAV